MLNFVIMVFSSIIFLAYFLPAFLFIYFILPIKFKNLFLLLASIFFYSWGAPKFIFVILGTTILDFYLVKWMDGSKEKNKRRLLLIASVFMNVGLLFYFKYCNFFIDNFNSILTLIGIKPLKWIEVMLPIGISFYTFESLTYVIDVYRKVHKPLDSFWHYQLYIILFPKLIAGPIIRYHEISDQITGRFASDNTDNKLTGFLRFAIGLSKKVLIANAMGIKADEIFNSDVNGISTSMAWIGMTAYTFQIYFDFSGYSDMAIGIGKMLGFKFPENFDNPYVSSNISEFWRRWHMTLGSWMKNYLYIPLGGNKVDTKYRLFFNLWIVFILSGFWHGAAWTFIFWGLYHGFFLILDRIFLVKLLDKTGKIPSVIFTFLIVSIGWVFFRSESLPKALIFIQKLFSFNLGMNTALNKEFTFFFILAILFSFFTIIESGKKIQEKFYNTNFSLKGSFATVIISICLFITCLSFVATTNFNPFIYFRF